MKKTITETMPNLLTDGGFFKYLPTFGNSTPQLLGISYSLNRSGNKKVTALVMRYLDNEGNITEAGERAIGQLLSLVYGENWTRLYGALIKEYDPIYNYNMEETGSETKKGSDVISENLGERKETFTTGEHTDKNIQGIRKNTENLGGETETLNYGEEVETDESLETSKTGTTSTGENHETKAETTDSKAYGAKNKNVTNSKNGFNEGFVEDNKTVENEAAYTDSITVGPQKMDTTTNSSGTEETNKTNQNTITKKEKTDTKSTADHVNVYVEDERTDSSTYGERNDVKFSESVKNTHDTTYNTTTTQTLKRQGNIGVTTTQKMLKEEIDIRSFDFYNKVFSDIDEYLTVAVY